MVRQLKYYRGHEQRARRHARLERQALLDEDDDVLIKDA
jgi:hypothetical protein